MPDARGTLSYETREAMGTISYPLERTYEIPWRAAGGIAVQIAMRRIPAVEDDPGDPDAVAVKPLHGGLSRLTARVVRPHNKNEAVGISGHLSDVRKLQARRSIHQHVVELLTETREYLGHTSGVEQAEDSCRGRAARPQIEMRNRCLIHGHLPRNLLSP